MRAPREDSESASRVRIWVDVELRDFYQIYLEKLGARFPIFETTYLGPLTRLLLDGHTQTRPAWAGDLHSPSEVLHCAVAHAYRRKASHWVELLCHDDAYWETRDIFPATMSTAFVAGLISRVYLDPADEAGCTCLALLYDDHTGMILFSSHHADSPPYPMRFAVDFYGSASEHALLMADFATVASQERKQLPIDRYD